MANCVFSYFYIARWNSNLKGNKDFAGDIAQRIKICHQTARCLFPQFGDSMSPPPRRHICIIPSMFLLNKSPRGRPALVIALGAMLLPSTSWLTIAITSIILPRHLSLSMVQSDSLRKLMSDLILWPQR